MALDGRFTSLTLPDGAVYDIQNAHQGTIQTSYDAAVAGIIRVDANICLTVPAGQHISSDILFILKFETAGNITISDTPKTFAVAKVGDNDTTHFQYIDVIGSYNVYETGDIVLLLADTNLDFTAYPIVVKADLDDKMDKVNPTGSGAFSMNRRDNTTVGSYSSTLGDYNEASGDFSHAEGESNMASGDFSHAEGVSSSASGNCSHAEGRGVYAWGECQHVSGKYNSPDAFDTYAEIIGNGSDENNRSNARTLDWQGNETIAGDLIFNGSQSLTSALAKVNGWTLPQKGGILGQGASYPNNLRYNTIGGALTGSGKELFIFLPFPFPPSLPNLSYVRISVRHSQNTDYAYMLEGSTRYALNASNTQSTIMSGGNLRSGVDSITAQELGVHGFSLHIGFKNALAINSSGTALNNNSPVACFIDLQGTWST